MVAELGITTESVVLDLGALFRHEHEVDVETLLRRFGLKKAKLSDDERRRLEAKVREIVAALPPPVRLPYEVRFFSYRKCSTALRPIPRGIVSDG